MDITLSNIASDLQISPHTAKNWLSLIERMYLAFPIYPLTKKIPRAIQKPAKVYFYDNADVIGDQAAILENFVATHLLKRLHFIEDYQGHRCQLSYLRDKDGREVDFVTIIDGEFDSLLEVKANDDSLSKSLLYYSKLLKPKRTIQLVYGLKRAYSKDQVEVMSFTDYFVNPPWKIFATDNLG